MQNVKAISNLRRLMLSATALFIFCMNGQSQCAEFVISVKGDTLNCKDAKGIKNGRWVIRTDEVRGEPGFEEEGEFVNDKKTGPWRVFTLQGDLLGIENYRWGYKHGPQQYFNTMGDLIREEGWLAQNPEKPTETVEVFDINDPKKVYLVEVKLDASTVPHGIWKVYEPGSGKLLKKENYILGKIDDGTGTANGVFKNEATDGTDVVEKKETKKEKPKPKEVADYEKKNSGKKKIKVRTGETGG